MTLHRTIPATAAASFAAGTLAALVATTAIASAEDISFIQCGDTIAEGYPELFKKWEEANPDHKIAVEVVGWAQCQDKVTTLAAAGNPPALAYVGSRTLKQFADNELIVPIEMTEEEKKSYYPHIIETVTFQDQIWGVPTAFSTKALYWNKGLFKKAGLDPEKAPTTWQELYDTAKTVKEKTGVPGFGLAAKTMDNTMHQFLHWVYTNDGKIIDGDKIALDSPQNVEALTWLGKMAEVSEEGPTAYEQDQLTALFNDQKIAMYEQGPWVRVRVNKDIEWGVAPLPLGPQAKGPGTLLITDSLAVFKGSGVEEKATEFAKFLTNPENQFAYEQAHGLTPLRPVPGVEEMVEADPTWKPFLDGISFGGPEPLFLDYKGFQNVMIDMVQSVVTGQAKPEEAIKKAASELEQYM
jgi:multiple sugar transport system substrate-binding protein